MSLVAVIAVPAQAQGILDQEGTAKVSGQVTRIDTGKPVTNADVRLLPAGISAVGRHVKVDANGRFEFAELAAGAYVLSVSADGYVNRDATLTQPSGRGMAVTLKDGQVFPNFDIAMAPSSSIDGRLLDEFGDPAPGVTVQAAQLMLAIGRTRLMPVGGFQATGVTDDRGQFHLSGMPAGDYYVMAMSGPFGYPNRPGMITTDDRSGFAVTYAPGTPIASEAKPVRLDVGLNANLTFPLAPAKPSNLSGTIVDATGRPAGPGGVMMFQTQGGDVRAVIPASVLVAPDGTFHIRNVPAGTYVLQGRTQTIVGTTMTTTFGTLLVTADGTEQSDLKITLRLPTTAHGHISFEGDNPPLGKNGVSVSARGRQTSCSVRWAPEVSGVRR